MEEFIFVNADVNLYPFHQKDNKYFHAKGLLPHVCEFIAKKSQECSALRAMVQFKFENVKVLDVKEINVSENEKEQENNG